MLLLFLVFLLFALAEPSENIIRFTFLQVNDVYELDPVSGLGGMARMATLKKQLLKETPNVFMILAGDLISPSAIGTAIVNGSALHGKQMISAMNAVGLDYATLGNHEMDYDEKDFYDRLNESKFLWICSNLYNYSYPNLVDSFVLNITNTTTGTTMRIGLVGLVLDENNKPYESSHNDTINAKILDLTIKELNAKNTGNDKLSMLAAITHQDFDTDVWMSQTVPGMDIIMGGHEHNHMSNEKVPAPVFKADSNMKTAWIHRFTVDLTPSTETLLKNKGNNNNNNNLYNTYINNYGVHVVRESTLLTIDSSIPGDAEVQKLADYWTNAAYEGFRKQGFEPREKIGVLTMDLDGRSDEIRVHPTNLTDIFCLSMLNSYYDLLLPKLKSDAATKQIYDNIMKLAPSKQEAVVITNTGGIRIDDMLPSGSTIVQYDVLRIAPFPNTLTSVSIPGSLLQHSLNISMLTLQGNGMYLAFYPNVRYDEQIFKSEKRLVWFVNDKPLDLNKEYLIITNNYMLSGAPAWPFDFLVPFNATTKQGNPEVRMVWDTNDADLRHGLVYQLKMMFGDNHDGDHSGKSHKTGQIIGVVIAILVVVAFVAVFIYRRKHQQAPADQTTEYSQLAENAHV